MQRCSPIALVLLALNAMHATAVQAETWEQQAERLQNVSAAMLDDLPFAEMPSGLINMIVKANVSLLPKTNSTVGGKSESVPSSPVHTVPTVQGEISEEVVTHWYSGGRLWLGYLPSGSEKLVGLNAAIKQSVYGVAWINRYQSGFVEPGFELGFQKGSAMIKGAITASDSDDEFKADTQITYGAFGLRVPEWRAWTTLMFAQRKAESEFFIPSDQTRLQLVDTLDDASPRLAEQLAVGMDLDHGVQVGVAQVFVPKRLTMTRLLMGWKVVL